MSSGPPDPASRHRWSYAPRRWSLALAVGLTALVALTVVSDLLHKANDAGRLSDLRSYYTAQETGFASCAGGLRDALVAAQDIFDGRSHDRRTAESLASQGVQACTPALNDNLFAAVTTPPPRSLAGYGVNSASQDLYEWAFPGATVAETDLNDLLQDRASATSHQAQTLKHELLALRALGERIQRLFDASATRLNGHLAPFTPSLVLPPPRAFGG